MGLPRVLAGGLGRGGGGHSRGGLSVRGVPGPVGRGLSSRTNNSILVNRRKRTHSNEVPARNVSWRPDPEVEVLDSATSDILPKDCWPVGYSRQMVDKLSFEKALQLRAYQDTRKDVETKSKKHLPGQLARTVEKKRPVETVEAMEDDGDSRISPARFLRPAHDIKKWWKLTPKNYEVQLERKLDDRYGTWSMIPRSVFLAAHNLGWALELKHFCAKNFNVAKRKAKPTLRGGEDGKALLDGLAAEYYLPDNMHECRHAVLVFGSVMRELYPWHDGMDIMLHVLLEVRDFAVVEDNRQRVRCFESWFNSVLHENATKCDEPPMGFKKVLRLARDQLRVYGYREHVPSLKKKQEAPERPRRGGAGGGGGSGGGGSGGGARSGGGGGGKGSTVKSAPDGSDERKGWVVRDRRLAKIGSENLCVDYALGECDKADPSTNSCKKHGLTLAHRCSVVLDPDVLPLKLCGQKHTRKSCKDSV